MNATPLCVTPQFLWEAARGWLMAEGAVLALISQSGWSVSGGLSIAVAVSLG